MYMYHVVPSFYIGYCGPILYTCILNVNVQLEEVHLNLNTSTTTTVAYLHLLFTQRHKLRRKQDTSDAATFP